MGDLEVPPNHLGRTQMVGRCHELGSPARDTIFQKEFEDDIAYKLIYTELDFQSNKDSP